MIDTFQAIFLCLVVLVVVTKVIGLCSITNYIIIQSRKHYRNSSLVGQLNVKLLVCLGYQFWKVLLTVGAELLTAKFDCKLTKCPLFLVLLTSVSSRFRVQKKRCQPGNHSHLLNRNGTNPPALGYWTELFLCIQRLFIDSYRTITVQVKLLEIEA